MIGCLFLYGMGFVLGYFLMKFLGYNKSQCYFLGAIYSSPHTTSIPVILFSIIGPVLDKVIPIPENFPVSAQKRGFLYIILNSIFSNIWKWSAGYYFIQEENSYSHKKELSYKKSPELMSLKKFLKEIITTPVVASVFSILVTCFPKFQEFLIKEDSYVYNSLMVANITVGRSYSFFVMFTLGLSLCESIFPEQSSFDSEKGVFFKNYDLIWASLGKLIVMPIIFWPILIYLCRNILNCDDVLLFLFLFMAMAPGAVNMIVICNVKGMFQESVSMLMVAMYGIGIVTLTLGVTGIISLIGYLNEVPA